MNKIIILIHSLNVGGMERVTSQLANKFAIKEDLEIHIVLYGIRREIFYDIHPNVIIHKPSFKFKNKLRVLSTIKTVFFLRNSIKRVKPNSILSFGEYWNNLVLLATLGLEFPIYIADRSTPLKNLGRVQNMLRKYLYPKAKALIVQTEKAKNIYVKEFNKLNIEVIGNPIFNIDIQNNAKRENIILTVGRLIETKHIDRLIQIFSKINYSGWKLIIVGENAKQQNTKEKLNKLINNLKLKDKVILVGRQKNVMSYYLKSKIFAFTSSSEGFPNVIGEAMSANLPVVAYDCLAGPSEIIKEGEDGFLIPQFDDILFQNKLEYLMNNEKTRSEMGIRASTNIKRFNTDKISEQFLKVILN